MSGPTIVVIGDALLDVDLRGESRRSCPGTSAPVLERTTRWSRPGGAALTAGLLSEHEGVHVVLLTALGEDDAAAEIARDLGAGVRLVSPSAREHTPTKTRILAEGVTVARVDEGCDPDFEWPDDMDVRALIDRASAVLVSDYGLGTTHQGVVRAAVSEAVGRVPVVWDPHPKGAAPVEGVDLVTPNETESLLAGDGERDTPWERASRLVDRWRARAVAVTLGEEGAIWSDAQGRRGRSRSWPMGVPTDTCGAGDAFAAACVAARAVGTDIQGAVEAGTSAATEFVDRGAAGAYATSPKRRGPAISLLTPSPITESARRGGGRVVATGGCFDVLHAGHVELLRRARELGDHLVVLLNDDASVRTLKGRGRPVVPEHDRAQILAALECVDTVVLFADPTPVRILERIRPDVWVKGGDYDPELLPETSVVREAGGEVLTMPLLAGRSTSGVIERIRERAGAPAL